MRPCQPDRLKLGNGSSVRADKGSFAPNAGAKITVRWLHRAQWLATQHARSAHLLHLFLAQQIERRARAALRAMFAARETAAQNERRERLS